MPLHNVPIILSCLLIVTGLAWMAGCGVRPSEDTSAWSSGFATPPDGVQIHYRTGGAGSTSLVFVHGWNCDLTYWTGQFDHFSADQRVTAVDLAGHGESGRARDAWTMSAFGDDVVAVIRKLDLDRVVLVGHSMGARVIVEAALQVPDRIIGLVFVDALRNPEGVATAEQADETVGRFEDDFVKTTGDFARRMFVSTSDPALIEHVVNDMASAPRDVALAIGRSLLMWDGRELVRAVRAPKRAINSDMQPTDLSLTGRYGIKVVQMSNVGHFVMMEDPETFNRLLDEAIAEFELLAGSS